MIINIQQDFINDFKNHFFQTGDEMSKRAKFIFVTWVGQDVSVMKKAKMSTDKALMKDVIQVRKEIQCGQKIRKR